MPNIETLRQVVEWGLDNGHSATDIASGLDIDFMTIATLYSQIRTERDKMAKSRIKDAVDHDNDLRAQTDPRYAAWLYATRGARRTLEGKTE